MSTLNPSPRTLARAFHVSFPVAREWHADTLCTYAREVAHSADALEGDPRNTLVEFDSSTRTLTRTPVMGA